jgi:hypothetical protein
MLSEVAVPVTSSVKMCHLKVAEHELQGFEVSQGQMAKICVSGKETMSSVTGHQILENMRL